MTFEESLITEYITQLDEQQLKALHIAKQHLESSFSLTKSIGFKQWLVDRERKKEEKE